MSHGLRGPSRDRTRIYSAGPEHGVRWTPVLTASTEHAFLSYSSEGILRMRPDGSAVCVLVPRVMAIWMTVLGDQLVYLRQSLADVLEDADQEDDEVLTLWTVPLAGGTPRELSRDVDPRGIAADADHVVWAERGEVFCLGRGAREPALVKGVSALDPDRDDYAVGSPGRTIAVDGDQLYWLTYDRRAARQDLPPWRIWRRRLDGGARAKVGVASHVAELCARGGRAHWLDPAVGLAVGGSSPTFAVPVGDYDVLYRAGEHLLLRAGHQTLLLVDGPPRVIPAPSRDEHWVTAAALPGALALATYVVPLRGRIGNSVWRVPIAPPPPMTLIGVDPDVTDACCTGGDLFTLSRRFDEDQGTLAFELCLIDHAGARYPFFEAPRIARLATDGEVIACACADDDAFAVVVLEEEGDPIRYPAGGDEIRGLAIRPQTIAWIAGDTLWVVLRSRGARAPRSAGVVGGRGRLPLVIIDSAVYVAGECESVSGVHCSRGGAAAALVWRAPEGEAVGRDLARIGADLFVVSAERTVWRLPTRDAAPAAIYTAPGDRAITRLAAGGGRLYLWIKVGAVTDVVPGADGEEPEKDLRADELVWLDPERPASGPTLVMYPREAVAHLVADDVAVQVILREPGWIIRIPHAPA